MITPVKDITWDDYSEAIPAFLCIIFMVCACSISDGIMFGVIFYVLCKALGGKVKEINKMTWVLFVLFVAKIVVNAL